MIEGICQLHIATLLDNRIVDRGIEHYLGGACITFATATTAGRNINGCNLCPALVLECKANGCFIIADFCTHIKHRSRLNLIELGCDSAVLHRVGAVLVKRGVYLLLIDHYVYLTLRIRSDVLAVKAYLLNLATAVLLPACNIEEVVYR